MLGYDLCCRLTLLDGLKGLKHVDMSSNDTCNCAPSRAYQVSTVVFFSTVPRKGGLCDIRVSAFRV
jgi:hypothetical protein